MMDDLKRLSQAVLSGIQGGNKDAGTGDAVVNNYARSSFGDVLANSAGGVGTLAGSVADQAEKAAERARQAQMQKIQDKLDPSKYRMERRDDGGFGFFDPDGKEIDINRYSQVTGMKPADILKESDNPFDLQYVNDYGNIRDVVTAVQNGDTDTLSSFLANNKNIDPKIKPEDLMRQLIEKYPHIYGKGNYNESFKRSGYNPIVRYNLGAAPTASGGAGITQSSYGY